MSIWQEPEWADSALDELTQLSMQPGIKSYIAEIAHEIDRRLQEDPFSIGESRSGSHPGGIHSGS